MGIQSIQSNSKISKISVVPFHRDSQMLEPCFSSSYSQTETEPLFKILSAKERFIIIPLLYYTYV